MAVESVSLLQGKPWAPGVAQGTVTRSRRAVTRSNVLILDQQTGDAFDGEAAAIILVNPLPFAHATVRLLRLGIPIVSLDRAQLASLADGQTVTVDGANGVVISGFVQRDTYTMPASADNAPAVTGDGDTVYLNASVGDIEGAVQARRNGATGIGLLRSESLQTPNRLAPGVDFYQHEFRQLFDAVAPLPVRVRLLDLAKDKAPPWVTRAGHYFRETGAQGSRLFHVPALQNVMHSELDAIDTLAADYELGLIIPFITHTDELRCRIAQVRSRVRKPVRIGAMIENPIAAMSIADFLREADFVAVGCNDLMQYLFAVDRGSIEYGDYLDPHNPALFRFMRVLAQQAGSEISRVQLCGLLSQIPGILPVMLGLGFRVFSVQPTFIPFLQYTVANTSIANAQQLANSICDSTSASEVMTQLYKSRMRQSERESVA